MTETTEFVYKRTPRGLVLDPITVQVQPPTKIIHEVDEVKFLNQNPDSIGPPIEDPRSYVGLEASTQMPLGNTYTLQLPIEQGNAGEVLENDGTGQLEWQTGGGIGDVIYTGPTPVPTTRQFAVYDGTDGKKILDSGVTAPPAGSGVGGDILTLTGPTDSVWSPPVSSGTVTSVSSTATVVDGVSLTATPNPITGVGSISLGGSVVVDNTNWKPGGAELAIANGGSGENTPQLAINALTSVAGANPGEVLTESGGDALWVAGSSGTVTGVAGAGGPNGLTLAASPNPIIGSGTIILGGTLAINNNDWSGTDLAIANGGSGESSAQLAINALTDVASAGAGDVLTKSGVNAAWAAPATDPNAVLSTSTFAVDERLIRSDGTGRNVKAGANATLRDTPTVRITIPEVYCTDLLYAGNLGVGVAGNAIWAFSGDLDLTVTPGQVVVVNEKLETPVIKISTGAGAGKVLTSDASGDATWETPGGGSYGEYYFNSNSTVTTNPGAGNFAIVEGTRIAGLSTSDFTIDVATPNIEYTGTPTIVVRVNVSWNWVIDDPGAGTEQASCVLQVFKNNIGGGQPQLFMRAELDDEDADVFPRSASLSGLVELSTNDTLDCRVANSDNAKDILVQNFNMNVVIV